MPTFKFSQWVLICMTARTKVNDGKVARLQVHQDVLVLDVPDGQHEARQGRMNIGINMILNMGKYLRLNMGMYVEMDAGTDIDEYGEWGSIWGSLLMNMRINMGMNIHEYGDEYGDEYW